RHLSDYQKVECGERLQDIESKKAKERQKETLPKKGEKGFNAVEKLPPHNKGKTRDKVAEKIGMSGRQYDKARKIYHEAPEPIKQQWKNGKISTHKAYKTIKTDEKQKQIQKQNKPTKNMPKDTYSVIYADPPWRYNFSKTRNREIENQYPTMTLEEIKNIELPKTTDDAVLYLWATAPKLVEALEVMKTWGFTYKTHAIWDKQQIGMGYWFRNQHELLLVGTKGNFSPPSEKNRTSSIFKHKRGKHSKKPDEIRTLINKWFPEEKKIELFARQKTKNWDIWGTTTNED
ncbi:MAG: MT-A70 family methyltransferase, partial [Petrotogales bacterium]